MRMKSELSTVSKNLLQQISSFNESAALIPHTEKSVSHFSIRYTRSPVSNLVYPEDIVSPPRCSSPEVVIIPPCHINCSPKDFKPILDKIGNHCPDFKYVPNPDRDIPPPTPKKTWNWKAKADSKPWNGFQYPAIGFPYHLEKPVKYRQKFSYSAKFQPPSSKEQDIVFQLPSSREQDIAFLPPSSDEQDIIYYPPGSP